MVSSQVADAMTTFLPKLLAVPERTHHESHRKVENEANPELKEYMELLKEAERKEEEALLKASSPRPSTATATTTTTTTTTTAASASTANPNSGTATTATPLTAGGSGSDSGSTQAAGIRATSATALGATTTQELPALSTPVVSSITNPTPNPNPSANPNANANSESSASLDILQSLMQNASEITPPPSLQRKKDRARLESMPRPQNYKTVPCRQYHSAVGCTRGDFCHFIHDADYAGKELPGELWKGKRRKHEAQTHGPMPRMPMPMPMLPMFPFYCPPHLVRPPLDMCPFPPPGPRGFLLPPHMKNPPFPFVPRPKPHGSHK